MSRQKLFNMIKSRGQSEVGRNVFDLTNRHVYSSKAAKITPVKVVHTYPKDFFQVSMREFTQNRVPMNTAAFLNGIKENSVYFVPYNTIWHNYNQYMATREDPDSTLLQERGINYEPRFALADLYWVALDLVLGKVYYDYLLAFKASSALIIATANQTPLGGSQTFWSYFYDHFDADSLTFANYIDFQRKYFEEHQSDEPVEGDYVFTATYDTYLESFQKSFKDGSWANMDIYFDTNHNVLCYEKANNLEVTNFDWYFDIFGVLRWRDWLQKLDMLGYGNIYPEVKTFLKAASGIFDVYFNETSIWTEMANLEIFMQDLIDKFTSDVNVHVRFLDTTLTDSTTYKETQGEITVRKYEYVNVYALYAYNKCFYDMFRNTYYDLSYNVRNYNCDFINSRTLEGSVIPLTQVPFRFYSLECHQWKKDMFTGVLPDNQLGDVSSLVLGDGASQTLSLGLQGDGKLNPLSLVTSDSLSSGTSIARSSSGSLAVIDGIQSDYQGRIFAKDSQVPLRLDTSHTHSILNNLTGDDTPVNVSLQNGRATGEVQFGSVTLNVLALKRAEAIQQYRQDLMRSGNRTRDIFQQIFGSSPKSEIDESPYFVEARNNPIKVNPIISTAETGNQVNGHLADIAARVTISGNDLSFKFSTEDFGCLIFLSYVIPESFYNSYRLDPNICSLTPEAHGLKYFQNLGLQPVVGAYLNNMRPSSFRQSVRGFAPPYIERKTDIDLVHGDFVDSDVSGKFYQGEMSHWVVARTDMQQSDAVTLTNFYIDPAVLDNVFTFSADDDYQTDHFITYCEIEVNSIRAFSEIGLPRFV